MRWSILALVVCALTAPPAFAQPAPEAPPAPDGAPDEAPEAPPVTGDDEAAADEPDGEGAPPDEAPDAPPDGADAPTGPADAPKAPADDPKRRELDKLPTSLFENDPARAAPSEVMTRVRSTPEIGECRRDPIRAVERADGDPETLSADALALQRERLEYDRAIERFAAVTEDYEAEVAEVLERSFSQRRLHLERRFDKQAAEIELDLKQRRLDAIHRFERFIAKYPDDPAYTPDAMFRLAELYYERSAVDYAEALERYSEEQALYARGRIPAEPQSPNRDYSDSVKLYRQLLGRFGDQYRYADAVYYLIGYVLQEQGEDLEARKMWSALVDKHPKSDYAPEVYLRIGENHFDYGEFAEAAAVYERALAYTESSFYDKALYKLAWTYFQMYDYDRAIRTFKQLIAWYDANSEAGGVTASALREEAIDYLARSLAEDDWDNDGVDDDNSGVGRALAYLSDGQPFENDIVAKYAESLYDLHDRKKYGEAIEVYRELIRRDPTALAAVNYQQQVVRIYDILRDIEAATRERQRLAEMFAPGSPWALQNRARMKEVSEATAAVENAMRRRALFLHQRAQELKTEAAVAEKPELLAEAFDHYKRASRAYEDYLAKYPSEPASYEMRFYLAETLYYSDQFPLAAAKYFEVASDPNQARFRETAAWSAVKSYERILSDAVDAGALSDKADPNRAWNPPDTGAEVDNADLRKATAEPYPQSVKDWMGAIDFYVVRDITRDGSRKPQVAFAYQAADVSMRYRDYESARDRFRQVIACFPDDPLAADAIANILNMYRDENDLPNLERWANIADRLALGDPELTSEIRKKIKVFKLGAQFQRAESLLAAGRHLEAAREFERLADENADLKFLDKAYYNAAMAYKEVKYYDSASRIFERLVTEPRFANSEFYNESLFELAENFKLFFNFERAVSTYMAYYNRTQGVDDVNRAYSLYTAARLLEYSGEMSQAAATYERYSNTFTARPDAASALYRAAEIHEELNQRESQKRILSDFVRRFQNTPGMGTRVLEAMVQLGEIALVERKARDAATYFRDVIREFQVQGHAPGTPAAAAAAQASFLLIERRFDTYVALRLTGTNQRRMAADLAQKKKMLEELELAYADVLAYKSLDWTIAAFYRLGEIYREFAKTLYAAPMPAGLDEEMLEIFITEIEDEGLRYENVAIERFERTVNESRRLKVTNAWARLALEAANAYKPQDYPLYKETKRAPTFTPRFNTEDEIPGAATP